MRLVALLSFALCGIVHADTQMEQIVILDNGTKSTYSNCILLDQYTSPVASCAQLDTTTSQEVYTVHSPLVVVVNDQLWVGCGLVYKVHNSALYQCGPAQ